MLLFVSRSLSVRLSVCASFCVANMHPMQEDEVHLAGLPVDLLERCTQPLGFGNLLRCAQVLERMLLIRS